MKTIKNTKRKAFTLIELLVVIVIIGILATITVPNISKYRRKADYTKLLSLDQQIKKLIGLGLEVELQMDYYDDGGTDKVRDTSGQNRDATIHGDADLLVDFDLGVGKAAYFDGVTGNYLTVTNDPVFDSDEFTISLMAKSDSETWSHYGFLAGRRPSFIVHPLIGSKRMEFFAIDNLNNSHLVICEVNDITNWNHYMMSVKNGTLRGWLNGELCQEFTLPANTTIQDSTAPLWIGRDSYIPDRILDGWIDNVRFFSVGIDKIQ